METMHGIVWDDGKVTRYPVPFSMNNEINEREEIIGYYVDPSTGRRHGYLLRKGVATLIDFPGALVTIAWDINNRGQVVGVYHKEDGVIQCRRCSMNRPLLRSFASACSFTNAAREESTLTHPRVFAQSVQLFVE